MDINQIETWLKDIKVRNMENSDVEVVNHSPLLMIGKGRQGAVFSISDDICMKVFGNEEDCDREHYALSLGQQTNLFPLIYAKGTSFIVMELIKGVDLREYLQSKPLTPQLSYKLIQLLITFKTIGFERIDHHKRQIILQHDGNIKVIDVARTVWRDRVYPYPRKLLTSLGEENKAIFMSHVQEMAPELYEEWVHYIRMDELAHQIYQTLLPEQPDKETLRNLTKQLLTTEDEVKYVAQLEGLVHKVFKEEWIKTMLARGVDPDTVMRKIDEYWDSKEQNQYSERERNNSGQRFAGDVSREHNKEKHHHPTRRYEAESYNNRAPKNGPRDKKYR